MATKKRLIDANALLERINLITTDDTCPLHIAAEIDQEIALAPTVDAVEVVRCKDCKHHEHFDALLYCGHTRGLAGSVAPDNFCSYGERRMSHERS
jgi:hypothetical protein